MKQFKKSEAGGVAIIAALAMIPLLGVTGIAIDYSRLVDIRSHMQNEADAAALYIAERGPDASPSQRLVALDASVRQRFGADYASSVNVSIEAGWIGETDYRIAITGQTPLMLLSRVPGFENASNVGVVSVAQRQIPTLVYSPPEVLDLEPEAADYNRIYVYCFNPEEADTPSKGRSHMIPIADNAGTSYSYTMPQCQKGEAMSYRLMNVRNARTKPPLWDNPHVERYDYYTDTVITAGVESYDLGGWQILETVFCETLSECKPKSQGGIIPEGKERTPKRATEACVPGSYMYYGWEDRPPGLGWTDRDYDDIRIIIGCPYYLETGDRLVRLIQ